MDLIGEWFAYHATAGITHFIIYDNMSTDGTSDVIARCSLLYSVTIIQWNVRTKFAHWEAYEHCIRSFRFVFDWIAFIDVDEFLLPVRDGTLAAFLGRLHAASAVAVPWAMFGSSGHDATPAGLTIDTYVNRATDDFAPNRHTKMVVRPHLVRQIHLSHYFAMDGVTVSPDGEPQRWESPGVMHGVADLSVCRVNHYFTRSREQWAKKMRRGYRDIIRAEQDFTIYDRNEVHDDVICRYSSAVAADLIRLVTIPARFADVDAARSQPEAAKGSQAWEDLLPTMTPIAYEPSTSELAVDPVWYSRNNPDVAAAGLGPLVHFWGNGAAEHRDPNPYFDTAWYIRSYPEAASYGRPPFVHFVEVGAAHGNRPNGRLPFVRPAEP